jgi:hypothetical protein
MTDLPDSVRHVRLELAREPGHPVGDNSHGYDLMVPLDAEGRIDASVKAALPVFRVRRFLQGGTDAVGRLVRRRGEWFIDYREGDDDDEAGFRFGDERFVVGEYVSIRGDDGQMHTFRVTLVERP